MHEMARPSTGKPTPPMNFRRIRARYACFRDVIGPSLGSQWTAATNFAGFSREPVMPMDNARSPGLLFPRAMQLTAISMGASSPPSMRMLYYVLGAIVPSPGRGAV